MKKRTGLYPAVQADAAAVGVVSHAGGIALLETVRTCGLDRLLSEKDVMVGRLDDHFVRSATATMPKARRTVRAAVGLFFDA